LWLELADALVDGFDEESRIYEQFAGFYRLEPLVVADLARRPLAADLLLGPERAAGAPVVKQADGLPLPPPLPHPGPPPSPPTPCGAGWPRARSSRTWRTTSRAQLMAARCRLRSTPLCSRERDALAPHSRHCGSRPGWTSTT